MTADQAQRDRALETACSCIVQAPAGSGKTELLSMRFLKLLALVDRPERVLAITFTRKATLEMKSRVMKRLVQAMNGEQPVEAHERAAVEAAARVIERDESLAWDLLANPNRMRISTIDSLCFALLSGDSALGPQWSGVHLTEDTKELYLQAVRRSLEDLRLVESAGHRLSETAIELQTSVASILQSLGGNGQLFENLLVGMLQSRSLWNRHLDSDRQQLEELFHNCQRNELDAYVSVLGRARLAAAMDAVMELGWVTTGRFELSNDAHPAEVHEEVLALFEFSRLFMTAGSVPRKPGGLQARFIMQLSPTPEGPWKELKEIYADWHGNPRALDALHRMATSPPLDFSRQAVVGDDSLLEDACRVLAMAELALNTIMKEQGVADYTAVAEAAVEALGTDLQPAELLLREDQRIDHILMDEFQDTSHGQFQLMERLTSGWEPGDGRTLFLVGDPMQSIYRFREADVGFFTTVADAGRLGHIELETLTLQSNFRSSEEVIDWVNNAFRSVFPSRSRVDSGEVAYTPFLAERKAGGKVRTHAVLEGASGAGQYDRIAELVVAAHEELGTPSVGILLRERKNAGKVSQALRSAGISFEAVNMVPLTSQPVIQDLLVLTRAVAHPLDRVAWTALLRAPCCALDIGQLARVIGDDASVPVLDSMRMAILSNSLEEAPQRRLEAACQVMEQVCDSPGLGLSDRVEMAWRGLAGPLWYVDELAEECAREFLGLLEDLVRDSPERLIERLQERLSTLYAPSRSSRVQLMTIHSAKGLEFDVVILPELERRLPRGRSPLMAVESFAGDEGGVLMAAMSMKRDAEVSLYRYLLRVDRDREKAEWRRLLYVACTRARKYLHLIASVGVDKKGQPRFAQESLLALLEAQFADEIAGVTELAANGPIVEEETAKSDHPAKIPLLRLVNWPPKDGDEGGLAKFEPYGDITERTDYNAAALGSVLHRWLDLIHDHFDSGWDERRIVDARESLRTSLLREGAEESDIEELTDRCQSILTAIVTSEEWMQHLGTAKSGRSWSELPVIEESGNHIRRHILDHLRLGEDGCYQITDYKTREPGPDDEAIRMGWAEQLERYRSLIETLEPGCEIRTRIATLE